MNYKQYLLTAKDATDFRIKFGELARNARGRLQLGYNEALMVDEYLADGNIPAAIHLGLAMLKNIFKPQMKVTHRRRIPKHRRRNLRQEYREDVAEFGMYDFESEELVPVIHGGDLGRINAILNCKRGYNALVSAPNPEKQIMSKCGFMIHSEYSGRAKYYARSAAEQSIGISAVLMAYVPKKYLYHNQGDEYTLHTWNYHHMQNVKVLSELDDEYYWVEEYYKENYLKEVMQHA